jgi:general secretion pathway protein B
MSFILDALKKSETERQQQGPSDFANVPSSDESPRAPRWLWALGLLLAVNLAVLLGVLLRDDTPETMPSPAQTAPAAGPSFSERIEEARERKSASSESVAASTVPAAQPTVERPTQEAPPATPPQSRPQSQFTLEALPTADELRANGSIQLGDLHLDIHVYSEKPADRFVFINMVRHRERPGDNAGRRHSRLRRNPFPVAARVGRATTIERACVDTAFW